MWDSTGNDDAVANADQTTLDGLNYADGADNCVCPDVVTSTLEYTGANALPAITANTCAWCGCVDPLGIACEDSSNAMPQYNQLGFRLSRDSDTQNRHCYTAWPDSALRFWDDHKDNTEDLDQIECYDPNTAWECKCSEYVAPSAPAAPPVPDCLFCGIETGTGNLWVYKHSATHHAYCVTNDSNELRTWAGLTTFAILSDPSLKQCRSSAGDDTYLCTCV